MMSLCKTHPATILWACSYLNNKERLQLGLCAKDFFYLLRPLFKSLAYDFACKTNLNSETILRTSFPTEGNPFNMREFRRSNNQLTTIDDDDLKKQILITKLSLCEECRISNFWKNFNEKRLTYYYNPFQIEDYQEAKNRAHEEHQLKSLLEKFKVQTPEAAIRHAAAKLNSISWDDFELLCRHVNDINQPSENGNTALHWALKAGNENFVHLLLKYNASCKVKNKLRETPLHFAAVLDSDHLAGKLMSRGADIHAKDIHGKTSLDKAIQRKKTACITLLGAKSKTQNQ